MLSTAPTTVKNDFTAQLKDVADSHKLASVKRYYDVLRNDIEENKRLFTYTNIDPRVENTRYFYFPTEASPEEMNCLERSASMYFAFKELYPRSEPALVYVTQPEGSIHALVLFRHQKQLHAACPSYEIFDKVRLEPDAIVLPPKKIEDKIKEMQEDIANRHKAIDKDSSNQERRLKYNKITQVNDSVLEQMSRVLRSDSGIIDFMYASGQNVADINWWPRNYLFMSIDDHLNVNSEIRMVEPGYDKNACIRFVHNPVTGVDNMGLSTFSDACWTALLNEKKHSVADMTPYASKPRSTSHSMIDQMQDLAYFIKGPSHRPVTHKSLRQFEQHPNVQERFGRHLEKMHGYDQGTQLQFLSYLRNRFGPGDGVATLSRCPKPAGTLIGENGNLVEMMDSLSEQIWTDSELQSILPMLKFVSDMKKYTAEASKHIIDNI